VAAVLALAGACVAGYLAVVQLGALDHAWDPIVGSGTDRVIESSVAKLLPFPDALLGVLGYAVEAGLALAGGTFRWRRRPWLALAFEAVALAFGVAGLGLLAIQGLVVGAWCSWCLASAVLSWAILLVTRGTEALAALRTVRGARRVGRGWPQALGVTGSPDLP
jgi:uncharacterized membrane protein